MNSLLLEGGRVLDPASGFDGPADVLIQNGIIAGIGPRLAKPAGVEVYSAAGKVVCPGFIDLHVHLREPGQTTKENLSTGTAAAERSLPDHHPGPPQSRQRQHPTRGNAPRSTLPLQPPHREKMPTEGTGFGDHPASSKH